jgi:hypothetical protein
METFEVKILQTRRRLGIKEISAPSIEVAESSITELLKKYLGFAALSSKVIYINRTPFERKFKLRISDYNFSISLVKMYPCA